MEYVNKVCPFCNGSRVIYVTETDKKYLRNEFDKDRLYCPDCFRHFDYDTVKPEPMHDYVDVVRCKDCRKNQLCELTIDKPKDWFCADGKRR